MSLPDSRPPLVLLHGALGAASQLAFLEALLAPDFDVRTLDFEGHGARGSAGRPFRMVHFADNLAELIRGRNLGPAHLVGYSMGGYVALLLAARQPELVHSIVTLGTKFFWDEPTAAREAARLDPATMQVKVPAFAQALAGRHAGSNWETVVRQTAEMLLDLGRTPLLSADVLGQVRQPVRVMVGDRDVTVSVEETAAAYRTLPAGQLQVLPGTPHPLERVPAEELAHSIRSFASVTLPSNKSVL